MCMDMQMKVQKAPFIVRINCFTVANKFWSTFHSFNSDLPKVLHFDCMRMGQDGVALVKPDQNGGLEVNTEGASPENPVVDTVPLTQTMQPGEPPQTDYDIYDEVTEVKINNWWIGGFDVLIFVLTVR